MKFSVPNSASRKCFYPFTNLNSCFLIFNFYVSDDVSFRSEKEKETRVIRKLNVHLDHIGGDVVVGGQSALKFHSRKKKGILCENE